MAKSNSIKTKQLLFIITRTVIEMAHNVTEVYSRHKPVLIFDRTFSNIFVFILNIELMEANVPRL